MLKILCPNCHSENTSYSKDDRKELFTCNDCDRGFNTNDSVIEEE